MKATMTSAKDFLENEYYTRLRSFLDTASTESDRGRVLVSASLIDEMLEEILRAYLYKSNAANKLFEASTGALSSLSAKTALARSLCLITPEEFSDIELVRRIRNAFAHSVLCTFDDEKNRDWAMKLKVGMQHLDSLENGHKSRVDEPRARFTMVTTSLVTSLYNRAHFVSKSAVQARSWPE